MDHHLTHSNVGNDPERYSSSAEIKITFSPAEHITKTGDPHSARVGRNIGSIVGHRTGPSVERGPATTCAPVACMAGVMVRFVEQVEPGDTFLIVQGGHDPITILDVIMVGVGGAVEHTSRSFERIGGIFCGPLV